MKGRTTNNKADGNRGGQGYSGFLKINTPDVQEARTFKMPQQHRKENPILTLAQAMALLRFHIFGVQRPRYIELVEAVL